MDRKLKVLHILHELHPSGAEMMLYNAKPYWQNECECTIMATGKEKGPFADRLAENGYEIAYVPTRGTGKSAKITHLKEFWHYMKKHSYDVVHIHRESLSFEYALIARVTGNRHICRTVHSTFAHMGRQRKIKGTTRAMMRKLGVKFIAISDGVAANEQQVFGNLCDEIIYNWCNNNKFVFTDLRQKQVLKAEKGLEEKLVLVTVGNCGKVKNHQVLLEAIAQMKQKEKIHYYHVGFAKDETAKEEQRVKELGIADIVEFLGSTDPMPYLKTADVFLMTSVYEGLSIATLEAIFTGMAVLLAEAPGLVEFKDKGLSNVRYFIPAPETLAETLDAYVTAYEQGKVTPKKEQQERAKQLYDCGQQVQKYVEVYRKLVQK